MNFLSNATNARISNFTGEKFVSSWHSTWLFLLFPCFLLNDFFNFLMNFIQSKFFTGFHAYDFLGHRAFG